MRNMHKQCIIMIKIYDEGKNYLCKNEATTLKTIKTFTLLLSVKVNQYMYV